MTVLLWVLWVVVAALSLALGFEGGRRYQRSTQHEKDSARAVLAAATKARNKAQRQLSLPMDLPPAERAGVSGLDRSLIP